MSVETQLRTGLKISLIFAVPKSIPWCPSAEEEDIRCGNKQATSRESDEKIYCFEEADSVASVRRCFEPEA